MPIDITIPFDDVELDDEKKIFLSSLQANILKGHGREHVALLFLKIKNTNDAKFFLRDYPVTSSLDQFNEIEAFKKHGIPGGVVRLVFITQAGLDEFGHGGKFFDEQPFAASMSNDKLVLDDGTTASWQSELSQPVHVLLLIAYHDQAVLANTVGDLVSDFCISVSPFEVLYVQEGKAYRNSDGEGIEHFGYVDGRSQPLMLKTQIDAENSVRRGGIKKYDPSAPLSQFLIVDPLSPADFGSYFVFRKLEQNVLDFKQAEDNLAEKVLELEGADKERAGAMVVGRFEDGTPITLNDEEFGAPVINNFDYGQDSSGAKCPFHGHIRKSNPRGSSPGGLEFDKSVQMARRGITYGTRLQHPDTKEFIDAPQRGVGLLFMSYQASIARQFQFMQSSWVNNPDFPHAGIGIDPIIGQGASKIDQTWFPNYDKPASTVKSLFKGFVSLKGGEYFFTPSLNGLKTI